MEETEGAALAYIAALRLWVVVNNNSRVILWTVDVEEAADLDMLIAKVHKEREAKVIRLAVRRVNRLVRQIRGTEVGEVEVSTTYRRRRTDHGTDTEKV